MRPLDPAFPIERQLALDVSPVVLVNLFTLDKTDEQAFLRAWQDGSGASSRPSFTAPSATTLRT
jgi:hypothetical protein